MMKKTIFKKMLVPFSIVAILGAGTFLYSSFADKKIEKTASVSTHVKTKMPTYETSGSYETYLDVTSMENASDLIVVASPKKPFDQRRHVTTYFEGPNPNEKYPEHYYTFTEMNVKKVLFSKESSVKKELKNLNILEPVGIIKDNDGIEKKLRLEGYEEMSNKQDYILYLEKNSKGNYNIVNIVDGKFETKNTSKKVDKHSILSEHVDLHSDLEKETKAKYQKELVEYTQ